MSQPLAYLLNIVFHKRTFPDACKIAKIIPLHKRGSSLDCNNYRPISLLSNIGKITETLINAYIVFLNKVNACIIYSLVSDPYIQQTCIDYYN